MKFRKLVVILLIIVALIAGRPGVINAQSGGASGSWDYNPWYQLNSAFGAAYEWFIYIMSYPLIQYGTWQCDDNGCGYF